MSFELDLTRFVLTVQQEIPIIMRKILLQAYKEITMLTPVRTGRARANWFPQEGTIIRRTTEDTVTDPGRAFGVMVSGERDLYISNSLPYIQALENGHSKQAPRGMVMITMRRLKLLIESGALSGDLGTL
jgi:hypothetical protein